MIILSADFSFRNKQRWKNSNLQTKHETAKDRKVELAGFALNVNEIF
jgi:hypothetical protein